MTAPAQVTGGPEPGRKSPKRQQGRVVEAAARFRHLRAHGEPMLWLTGTGLAVSIAMIVALLALVLYEGLTTFWPTPVVRIETSDGRVLVGEVTRSETYRPTLTVSAEEAPAETQPVHRRLVRIGNFELTGEHFAWVADAQIAAESTPPEVGVFERTAWGRFYGTPSAMLVDGVAVTSGADASWQAFNEYHTTVRSRWHQRRQIESKAVGSVNRTLEEARLEVRSALLAHGEGSPQHLHAQGEYRRAKERIDIAWAELRDRISQLNEENDRYVLRVTTGTGVISDLPLATVVRAYRANSLGLSDKIGVYLSRWREFLLDEPREANSEGGVFPAIFGTVMMTLIMSVVVTPLGVLAALYIREYAKPGPVVSTVRVAVNNLAGVPSIVFGVFGLGFFCYIIGASVDELFFRAKLPAPTYGTGGILWASLTLALLTLPVVIVATEEALAAVPSSMREGSYACGASKWQTIRRIVLPRALPGILTGMILAIARGAGEVAPLMLVGAVKLAPELPFDGVFPYFHLERSFMHLGFHIYDLGFQSQNSEAAKPMVYTTTLLLVAIVATLNVTGVYLRGRARRRFAVDKF